LSILHRYLTFFWFLNQLKDFLLIPLLDPHLNEYFFFSGNRRFHNHQVHFDYLLPSLRFPVQVASLLNLERKNEIVMIATAINSNIIFPDNKNH